MKRFIVAIALLLITVLGCLYSYRYLRTETYALAKQVAQIDSSVKSGAFEQAALELEQAYDTWEKKHKIFCMLVRHIELDEVEFLFLRARQHIANQDAHSYLVHSSELQGYLLHIPEMELPSLPNIF